ncbi:MAG: hypothetical protein IJS52_11035, partial [Bacilli bacterium]|nr:hypothetical protein [Bacilli bacterium]
MLIQTIAFLALSCLCSALVPAAQHRLSGSGSSPDPAESFQGVCFSEMTSYFAALTGNFPLNEDNQCVAVATNMVCSFYDTYYNDNIINDGYERPVVGSWHYDAHGNAMYFTPSGSSPGAGFVYDPDYVKTGQDVLYLNPSQNSDLLLNVPAGPISPLPGIQLSLQAMDSTGTLALSQWCPLTN